MLLLIIDKYPIDKYQLCSYYILWQMGNGYISFQGCNEKQVQI